MNRWTTLFLSTLLTACGASAGAPQDVIAQSRAIGPLLGPAAGVNVFSCDDFMGGVDVEGPVAVARNSSFKNFSVGRVTPGGNVLVVGEDLSLDSGTVWGSAVYGSLASVSGSVNFAAGGSAAKGSPIDFSAACDELMQHSELMAKQAENGTTLVQPWGAIELTGADPVLNVFSVNGADIDASHSLSITAPASSRVVVNVSGDRVSFAAFRFKYSGIDKTHVVYNFPVATWIEATSVQFEGSVMAPCGCFSCHDGNLEGGVGVMGVKGDCEYHHDPAI